MEAKDLTIELLVRSGNPEGVEVFASKEHISDEKKETKIAEAGIYSAIKLMGEEAEGGIDSARMCEFFNRDVFKKYFDTTRNVTLLCDLVDVLVSGTHAMMEAYAQISAIDVLGVNGVANALRRNLDDDCLKKKVVYLVNEGCCLVFCTHDIDRGMLDNYFPILSEWQDLVDKKSVVENAIKGFADDLSPLAESDTGFVYAAFDKLIELTDREFVSKIARETFEREDYDLLEKNQKVDSAEKKKKRKTKNESSDVARAVKVFENSHGFSFDAKTLATKISRDADRKYVGEKLGEWLKDGLTYHLKEVFSYEQGQLYDESIGRKSLAKSIAELVAKGDVEKLEFVLTLPEELLDKENPALQPVIAAYEITKATKPHAER